MKVLKFGGTSVKTSENIKKVISIVVDISSGTEVVVVVSALGGITDLLHLAAKQASIADPIYIQTLKEILVHMVRNEGYQQALNLLYEIQRAQERMNKMTTKAKEASLEDIVKEKKDNSIDDQKEIPEK